MTNLPFGIKFSYIASIIVSAINSQNNNAIDHALLKTFGGFMIHDPLI
jgi:hypothetical protein